MGDRIRAFDWAQTPLGPPECWPQALRVSLGLCLQSSFPSCIYWGQEMILLYNDAWSSIPGPRHPAALGRSAREVWADIWPVIEPQLMEVFATRQGFSAVDQLLTMQRYGAPEETYWDYSFTPIVGEDGKVAGIFNQGRETTARVLQARQDRLLTDLEDAMRRAPDPFALLDRALAVIGPGLGVDRVGYAEIDEGGRQANILRCWSRGLQDISGTHGIDSFGKGVVAQLMRGDTVVIEDLDDELVRRDGKDEAFRAIGAQAVVATPVTHEDNYIACLFVHSAAPRHWFNHEIVLLESATDRIWRELARLRADVALRDSEERHRLIFEQAHDIIITADLDQVVTAANPAAGAAFGGTAQDLIGKRITDFVVPADQGRTTAMLARKLDQGGTTRYDIALRTLTGATLKLEVTSSLLRDRDGRPIGLQAIARDVTEQRAFDERQQLLIHELNHRVKNTLALVQALALQSLKPGRQPEQAAADFQSRLAALAAAHDLLTREQWEGATLADLAEGATRPIAAAPGRIDAEGPPVEVTPKAAVAIVMALHELSTNATKYGALSVLEGHVTIRWALGDGRLRIVWREEGGPPVAPPTSRGFGVRMIERALASDLSGEVRIGFEPGGVVCTIDAPITTNVRKEAA